MSLKPIRNHYTEQSPIYEIIMIEFYDKVQIGKNGKSLDFPDWGITSVDGFYYEYETAVRALHENWCDLNDGDWARAAYIIRKYPGLYPSIHPEDRTFFIWDEERQGYYEAEEPEFYKKGAFK